MKRANPDDFAERNADFILSYLQTLWPNAQSYSAKDISKIPNNEKGLYIFFIHTEKKKYPVYIGITSRNFRKRMQEHASDKTNGVINYIIEEKKFPQKTLGSFDLNVMCVPIESPVVAKAMESVFLASFDFCLNTSENEEVRQEIDTNEGYPVGASKKTFDTVFKKVFEEIKVIYEKGGEMKMVR